MAWLALWPLTGCAPYTGFADQIVRQDYFQQLPAQLGWRTYRAVDRIIDEMQRQHSVLLRNRTPVVVGSIADIADVNRSTPLGNTIAELVRTHLVQRDVPVSDMLLRNAIALRPRDGELALSRNPHDVRPPPLAGIIATGTYAVGRDTVFVSVKMIRATDAQILAAAEFRLPRNGDINRLLAERTAGLR